MQKSLKGEPLIGRGMKTWSKKLHDNFPDLAEKLNEPREAGFKAVENLDLPRYKRFVIPANDLLQNPNEYFDQLSTELYFVFLQPNTGTPVRKTKLTQEQALNFIQETLKENPEKEWTVNVSETYEEIYGGNIYVVNSGFAQIEFHKGSQGEISAGTVTSEYQAWQDEKTGIWRYSFDDQALRKQVQNLLLNVPHDEHEYLPGLYEFHLVQEKEDGPLKPKFIDYRNYNQKTKNPPLSR